MEVTLEQLNHALQTAPENAGNRISDALKLKFPGEHAPGLPPPAGVYLKTLRQTLDPPQSII